MTNQTTDEAAVEMMKAPLPAGIEDTPETREKLQNLVNETTADFAFAELYGSDFEAVRRHATTLRAQLTAATRRAEQAERMLAERDAEAGRLDQRETDLMGQLAAYDYRQIDLCDLVERGMELIPEGKSLWWDDANALLTTIRSAASGEQG